MHLTVMTLLYNLGIMSSPKRPLKCDEGKKNLYYDENYSNKCTKYLKKIEFSRGRNDTDEKEIY